MSKTIIIRADGNHIIGSGHIMRCLSIAFALRKQGAKVCFVCADESMKDLIAKSKFNFYCLNSDYSSMEKELASFEKIIREICPSAIVLDSYFVTSSYMKKLQKLSRLIYIDDINAYIYPCDVLVNYGIFADDMAYISHYEQGKTSLLLGVQYAPLREQFARITPQINMAFKNILISVGGADPMNITYEMLSFLLSKNNNDWCYNVLIGALSPHYKQVLALSEKHNNNIHLFQKVTDMACLMQNCDAAVSAGGSTLYELCACGTPTISFSFADNQMGNVLGFANRKIIDYAGDIRENKAQMFENIKIYLETMDKSYDKRVTQSNNMKKLINGNGANELALVIMRS